MMITRNDIDIFITAGGESRRMGQDKGLISVLGKPMIRHLTDSLDQNDYSYSVIGHAPEYKNLGFKVFKDIIPHKGPMGALLTAFYYSKKKYILLLACDTPFLPMEVIGRLIHSAKPGQINIPSIKNHIQPLMTIYPVSLMDDLLSFILEDLLKMKEWIGISKFHFIEVDDLAEENPGRFMNFNKPNDIKDAKYSYRK